MKKLILAIIAVSGLSVFFSYNQTNVFCDTAASQARRMGGLMENEVISLETLRQKQLNHESFLFFDARGKKNYDEGHIEGAVLPLAPEYYRQEELFRLGIIRQLPEYDKALAEAMSSYPKDTPLVTYCNDHCQASAMLLYRLKKLGFHDVKAMEGGFQSWEKKNYPIAKSNSS